MSEKTKIHGDEFVEEYLVNHPMHTSKIHTRLTVEVLANLNTTTVKKEVQTNTNSSIIGK